MPFIYCQSCGTKMDYSTQKPNFCMKCGTPTGKVEPSLEQKTTPLEEVEASHQSREIKLPTKLEYEITNTGNIQESNIGNTLNQGNSGLQPIRNRPSYKPKGKDAAEDIRNFCQSSKTRDVDESG